MLLLQVVNTVLVVASKQLAVLLCLWCRSNWSVTTSRKQASGTTMCNNAAPA